MNGRDLFKALTGFKPSRSARYAVLLDYGYGPDKWVQHGSARTEEGALKLRRSLPQWANDKIRIIDLEETNV